MPHRARVLASQVRSGWPWAGVVAVAIVVRWSAYIGGLPRATAAIIVIGLIAWLSRFPGPVITALVVLLPFQTALFSWLYERGVPGDLLRYGGAAKEILGLALLLSAVQAIRREGRPLDWLDRAIIVFILFVVLALMAPALTGAANTSVDWPARVLGLRSNISFLVLFVAARHAPIGAVWRTRAIAAFLMGVAVMAVLGLYQYLNPSRWFEFIVDDIQLLRYQTDVVGVSRQAQEIGLTWMRQRPPRTGSLLVSPFEFGDLMIVGTALGMAFLVRRKVRVWPLALFAGGVLGVLASNTRACLLGLAAAAIVVVWPSGDPTRRSRVRFIMVIAAGALVAGPGLVGSRFTGADGASKSSADHVREFTEGLERVVTHPLGQGLGTAPNLSVRFDSDLFVSDNTILQVGEELGVVPMALFVVIVGGAVWRLRRADVEGDPDDVIPLGLCAALVGLLAAGMLHHVFLATPTAWPCWALAGLALSHTARSPAGTLQSEPVS